METMRAEGDPTGCRSWGAYRYHYSRRKAKNEPDVLLVGAACGIMVKQQKFGALGRGALVAVGCVVIMGCNSAAAPVGGADASMANTGAGMGDASDGSAACKGPLDVSVLVIDQSGAFVGQANVTLSSETAGEDATVRTDAFGVASLQVPEPGTYQVFANKSVQIDPEIDYAFEEFVALGSVEVSCSEESLEVHGEWGCAAVVVDAFALTVIDESTGQPICNARVVDTSANNQILRSEDFGEGCVYSGRSGAGQHEVTIEATGYTAQSLTIDVDSIGIYCSYPVSQALTVALVPEG